MRLLLDTHVVLWAFTDDPSLSADVRDAIIDGRNAVFVSAASAWEIAVKKALGKLRAPDDFENQLVLHRFTPLDITCAHARTVEHLPVHHRDPFDRMIVAQATREDLRIVTRDPNIARYDVDVLEA